MRRSLELCGLVLMVGLAGCRREVPAGGVNLQSSRGEGVTWDRHFDGCHFDADGSLTLFEGTHPLMIISPDRHVLLHGPEGDVTFHPSPRSVYKENFVDTATGRRGNLSIVYEQDGQVLTSGVLIKGCK